LPQEIMSGCEIATVAIKKKPIATMFFFYGKMTVRSLYCIAIKRSSVAVPDVDVTFAECGQ